MDHFNCERCDERTHFEASFYSIADRTEALEHLIPNGDGSMVTFYYPPYGRDYTTAADCVCLGCGLAATGGRKVRFLRER